MGDRCPAENNWLLRPRCDPLELGALRNSKRDIVQRIAQGKAGHVAAHAGVDSADCVSHVRSGRLGATDPPPLTSGIESIKVDAADTDCRPMRKSERFAADGIFNGNLGGIRVESARHTGTLPAEIPDFVPDDSFRLRRQSGIWGIQFIHWQGMSLDIPITDGVPNDLGDVLFLGA